MRVKYVLDEDFINYRKPSMLIGTISCVGKCCNEYGLPISACQNDSWRCSETIEMDDKDLCERYLANAITSAVVIGGLEPFEQFSEVLGFIRELRNEYGCEDDVVIYTGYYPDEIERKLVKLRRIPNIIVKFGRYVPNDVPHYDKVLGINLANTEQYAERIS